MNRKYDKKSEIEILRLSLDFKQAISEYSEPAKTLAEWIKIHPTTLSLILNDRMSANGKKHKFQKLARIINYAGQIFE